MDDVRFMREALAEAGKGLGRTAPNPPVGAVIVRDGVVVGRGFHPRAGEPHAEIFALRDAGELSSGATCYVTLEPCSHHGRTGPCADALIKAGVVRVVAGCLDPNPVVAGRGVEKLRAAGVDVLVGVEERECRLLTRWYRHWMQTGRCYVICKAAMTLDGRIATDGGDAKWISGEDSRRQVHELRNHADAILVGSGTVLADDPRLTCRVPGGRDPLRVIMDRDMSVPAGAQCLGEGCLVFAAENAPERPEIAATGAEVVRLAVDGEGHFSWSEVFEQLGARGVHAVLVEGGSGILSSLLRAKAFDQLLLYVAPKLLGGGRPLVDWGSPEKIADSLPLVISRTEIIGSDVLIEAYAEGTCSQD